MVLNGGGGFDVQLAYTYAEELSGATFSVTVTDHSASTREQKASRNCVIRIRRFRL